MLTSIVVPISAGSASTRLRRVAGDSSEIILARSLGFNRPQVDAFGGNLGLKRCGQQLAIGDGRGFGQISRIALAAFVQHAGVQRDRDGQEGLRNAGRPLPKIEISSQTSASSATTMADQAIGAEAFFGGVAGLGARVLHQQRRAGVVGGARVQRALKRSFVLLPVFTHNHQGDDVQSQRQAEQCQAQSEGDQGFRAGEFGIAGQLADDFHRHGGHRLERVKRQLGGGPCPHHHDHRLTNRAACGQQNGADDAGKRCGDHHLLDGFRRRGTKAKRAIAQAIAARR